ncbi:hypothetical protein L9F63_016695, partial [Diploptera punctata]
KFDFSDLYQAARSGYMLVWGQIIKNVLIDILSTFFNKIYLYPFLNLLLYHLILNIYRMPII